MYGLDIIQVVLCNATECKGIRQTTMQCDVSKLFSKWHTYLYGYWILSHLTCAVPVSGERFQSCHLAPVRGFSAVKSSDFEIAHCEFAGFFVCGQKRLLGVPHCWKAHFAWDGLTLALFQRAAEQFKCNHSCLFERTVCFLGGRCISRLPKLMLQLVQFFLPCLFVRLLAPWYPARYLWFAFCTKSTFLILRGWNISMPRSGRRARPGYFKIFRACWIGVEDCWGFASDAHPETAVGSDAVHAATRASLEGRSGWGQIQHLQVITTEFSFNQDGFRFQDDYRTNIR